jgi:PIN domain nuclease of toxin-antitoxin system
MTKGFLLDTSVLIWLDQGSRHIGPKTTQILSVADLCFSTISVAELTYKRSIGKIEFLDSTPTHWRAMGLEAVDFDLTAAAHFGRYSSSWVADPFDRLIMATASANNLTLLTADRRILEQDFDWVLDATT